MTEGLGPCCGWEPTPSRSAVFAWRVFSAGSVFSQRWWHLKCRWCQQEAALCTYHCPGLHCRQEGCKQTRTQSPLGLALAVESPPPAGRACRLHVLQTGHQVPRTAPSLGHRSEAAALPSLCSRRAAFACYTSHAVTCRSAGRAGPLGCAGPAGPGRGGRKAPAFSETGVFL